MTAPISQARDRMTLVTIIAAAILVIALLGYVGLERALRNAALAEAQVAAAGDAAILAEGLQSELEKFSLVPLVLAEDPQVQELLAGDFSGETILNQRLEELAVQTGAATIYLTDANGTTLAASNWQLPTSFVGSNYAFRRYFTTTMESGNATQFALGTVSRRPGLYMAQRVGAGAQILGIVAVKVEFDALELSWLDGTEGVFVTDADGVVLVTSNPDWRFNTVRPEVSSQRDRIADERQFGLADLPPMPNVAAGATLVETALIEAEHTISPNDWVLHLLFDPAPRLSAARANAQLALILALFAASLVGGAVFVLRSRRQARMEMQAKERATKWRDQMQQANRLAMLGQVTAGIGHEIRQPVSAMRVYAENGSKMIGLGDTASAKENFGKIVSLADRIGMITEELRQFSRQNTAQPREISLGEVIEGALLMLGDRITNCQIALKIPEADDLAIKVRGEHVGLEQVLINLLQNAIDASGAGGKIEIEITKRTEQCALTVSDSGPGLTDVQRNTLFQPFATTKQDGLGLGLVISQDIMRSLGGSLNADANGSGARFTMTVPLA